METEVANKYYNKPQSVVMLTGANTTICVLGRGTGKTVGIQAPKLHHLINSMPRSTINIYNSTYRQFMLQTGKELFYGLGEIGYVEGEHYVYRKAPPSKWPKPYRNPVSPDFSIFFYNGTVAQVMSEDVFNNGGSAQAMLGDEARKFDRHKFNEVILAMRDETNFEGNPDYLSLTLTTDQPQSPAEMWLFEYEKLMDKQQIELIQDAQLFTNELILKMQETEGEASKAYYQREIVKWNKYLREIRKNSVLFLESSTLENVYALGVNYIDKLKKFLPDDHFSMAVLNNRIRKVERSFFPTFNRSIHSYTSYNYEELSKIGIVIPEGSNLFSSQDSDVIPDNELYVCIDSSGTFNCAVVGQRKTGQFAIVNCFHDTEKISNVAKQLSSYYKGHRNKTIKFVFDRTQNAKNTFGLKAYLEFSNTLRADGWDIYEIYVKPTYTYESRYLFFQNLFAGNYKGTIPDVLIQKDHCENLIIGIETAQTKPNGKDRYELDKSLERKKNQDQSKITHYPEAFMTLVYTLFHEYVGQDGGMAYIG